MRFRPTAIEGFLVVELDVHEDARGGFSRTYCEDEFRAQGIDFRVSQANLSTNRHAHTLRGLHLQAPPHGEPKLVSCVRGRIFDVAVDLRASSPTYLRWEAVELAPELGRMVYLDAGLAHGFLTLEPDSDAHYLMGTRYRPESARGYRWDDPAFAIAWPAAPAIISDRDAAYPLIDIGGGQ
ncbi:MAG: dTDP-4-dehydrorhamnose 3,5-epimerase family protein [Allosphingosinicella sp.]